jgi:thymidine phosphorylase
MSKKLAEGLSGLVLDVKTGAGAFMPDLERALTLARTMVNIGTRRACPVVALLTNMDQPLGVACGNAVEIEESIELLRGGGPADTREVTLALGAEMLVLGNLVPNAGEARVVLERALADGRALEKFRQIVEAQGGDPRVVDAPEKILPQAPMRESVMSNRSGYVVRIEPRTIGRGIIALGGGRNTMEDAVDPSVGFRIVVNVGDRVMRGQPLATVLARDVAGIEAGKACIREAVQIGEDERAGPPLISHRVTADGVQVL